MRESYVECVAPRPNAWWQKPLFIFFTTVAIICATFMHWIFLTAAGVSALLAYLVRRTMNIEYEYILNGNDLSVDKVINQKKRKHLADFRVAKIEFFASVETPQVYNYRRRCTKFSDYSSGKYSDQYAMVYAGQFVTLTPSRKLLEALKPALSHKFIGD